MTKAREYKRRVRRLLDVLEQLAVSLVDEAPSPHSRSVYLEVAADIIRVQRSLVEAKAAGATRAELADVATDLKTPLHWVGRASTELPIARPDLLSEAIDLSILFQEHRYAGIV
jgi:hypothetical protein